MICPPRFIDLEYIRMNRLIDALIKSPSIPHSGRVGLQLIGPVPRKGLNPLNSLQMTGKGEPSSA